MENKLVGGVKFHDFFLVLFFVVIFKEKIKETPTAIFVDYVELNLRNSVGWEFGQFCQCKVSDLPNIQIALFAGIVNRRHGGVRQTLNQQRN